MLTYYFIDYFLFLSQISSHSCSPQLCLGADELVGVISTELTVQIGVSARNGKQIIVAERMRYSRRFLPCQHPVRQYLNDTPLL